MKPFHVIVKPISNECNLDCDYCFYIDNNKELSSGKAMSEKTLANFITKYIKGQPKTIRDINFVWQGGEPTLLGVDYFKKVVELQKIIAGKDYKKISNSFQTNGILIDDEWCEFFKENNFLVGISIDGDEEQHNTYRKDKNGNGTYQKVKASIKLMNDYGVDVNALCVLNNKNTKEPQRTYEALKSLGLKHLQFIPLVEREERKSKQSGAGTKSFASPKSVKPKDYGIFLKEVFDLWSQNDMGNIFINDFENYLSIILHGRILNCYSLDKCGENLAIESRGAVYSCDHYVNTEFELGNINETGFDKLLTKKQHKNFKSQNQKALVCQSCKFLKLCNGGCPAHRDSENKNYLCESYHSFLEHAYPDFYGMSLAIRKGHSAHEYKSFKYS